MFASIETMSHATVVLGNRKNNLHHIKQFLTEQGITIVGNPDVVILETDQLLIDDARTLVDMLASKKLSEKRFCIISCDRMAQDVQNTLLKTLEEPHPDTFIIVLISKSDTLLPTVLSRVHLIHGSSDLAETRLKVADFLKASLSERFAMIEKLTRDKKDENNLSKEEVLASIDHLEKILWDKNIRDEALFTDIRQMRSYAMIRGASHRIILDYIAMILPVLK